MINAYRKASEDGDKILVSFDNDDKALAYEIAAVTQAIAGEADPELVLAYAAIGIWRQANNIQIEPDDIDEELMEWAKRETAKWMPEEEGEHR